jgi:hypothetical protein
MRAVRDFMVLGPADSGAMYLPRYILITIGQMASNSQLEQDSMIMSANILPRSAQLSPSNTKSYLTLVTLDSLSI